MNSSDGIVKWYADKRGIPVSEVCGARTAKVHDTYSGNMPIWTEDRDVYTIS